MAISVTHTFVSPVADAGNPDEVGPNEWNAAHTISGLGTAAEADSTDFATAAQGVLADSAVQPGDVDALVSANADVAANTAARHAAVTVTDSAEINFTLTGQDITASLVAGSIDESKLDTSVNASLDLADSAVQPAAIANMLETADIGVSVQAYDADLAAWAGVNPSSYLNTSQIAAAYQPLDSDLTAIAALSTQTFGRARLTDAAAEDARNAMDTAAYVATRTALKALDTTKDTVAVLTEAGREGLFLWYTGDYSTQITADTQEGIYVKATAIASTSGSWVRVHAGSMNPDWFGATGGSNDAVALQACLTLAYTYGWVTRLQKLYTSTSALNVRDQVIEGTDLSCGIKGNHSGRTLNLDNVSTDGLVLRNMLVQGNGTNATNGTSTGLWVSSSTEITAHVLLENVRFWRHGKGTDGTGTFTLFDSTFIKVDFLECATWGQHLSGSQTVMVGCTYRVCGWGVFADAPSGSSISGGNFDGCTWVQNNFDMVFGSNTVRPIRIYGGWMEQTVTASFGTTAVGEVYFQSLVVDGCLFQPAATAVLDGVWSLASGARGTIMFSNSLAFKSPYSLASIPGGSTFYSDEGDLNFRRLNCSTDDGSGNVALLLDEYNFGAPVTAAASVLLSDFTGSNANTAQPIFSSGQDALNLAADTTYEFEAEYFITRAAGSTSHTTGVLFGGTATFDAIGYLAQVTNPTGNALANVQQIWSAAATEVVLTAANTSTTENLLIRLRGRIRTNAAGTLIPQFKYSAAPGGAPTIKANSAFRIWPIGSDQIASIGPWA